MTDADRYWLAGLLEGEGSFLKGPPSKPNGPQMTINMCDEDVIARVAKLFGVAYHRCRPRKAHHKESFTTVLRGRRAVALMCDLRELMGTRRRSQIDRALFSYEPPVCKTPPAVEEVRQLQDAGNSIRAIARRFGVSRSVVERLLFRVRGSMGEHSHGMRGIEGSSPSGSTT